MNNEHIQHSQHAHHHDHTHGMAKQALRIAFLLTIVILFAELIGGFLSHSLALISDAAHTLTDIFALGLAWFAAVQAERPANARNTFGYHRVGILAALTNAITLILVAIFILWEAIQRFQHPEPVTPGIMSIAALISILINLYIGFGLRREKSNLNVRAATLHVFGDIGASVAVIVAGVVILFTGWTFMDPLLSVAIALYIAFGAWSIVRETADILLESAPKDITLGSLVDDVKQIEGVNAVHDLHVWCISNGMTALSCHISVDEVTSQENARILHDINELLEHNYNINHATVQLECKAHSSGCCTEERLYCQLEQSRSHQHEHTPEHVA
jgi:cobalt-zinc-cadmium efflux system protein